MSEQLIAVYIPDDDLPYLRYYKSADEFSQEVTQIVGQPIVVLLFKGERYLFDVKNPANIYPAKKQDDSILNSYVGDTGYWEVVDSLPRPEWLEAISDHDVYEDEEDDE